MGTDQSGTRRAEPGHLGNRGASMAVGGVRRPPSRHLRRHHRPVRDWVRGGWPRQAIIRVREAISSIPLLIWSIALVGHLRRARCPMGAVHRLQRDEAAWSCWAALHPDARALTYISAARRGGLATMSRADGCRRGRAAQPVLRLAPTCLSPVIFQATLPSRDRINRRGGRHFVGLSSSRRPLVGSTCLVGRAQLPDLREWWLSVFPGRRSATVASAGWGNLRWAMPARSASRPPSQHAAWVTRS